MERWLAALERRFGRHLPGNLTYWLVGLMGLTFVMEMVAPGFSEVLRLDPGKVLAGQVWRLVTWLALPPSQSPIFVVFALLWLYRMGATLERDWGAARYVAWWLVGVVCTAVAAFFLGMPGTNGYLLMALFLAYATLHPDERVLLFFVVPVPIKWLALLDGIGLLYLVGTLPGREALMPLVAVGNYLLFFTPTLVGLLRGFARKGARAAEAKRFRGDEGRGRVRRCALCGVTDEDPSVDIRVCSCAKCGQPTELCLPHARNH
jgi:membrane associated rhomboid family serine protease